MLPFLALSKRCLRVAAVCAWALAASVAQSQPAVPPETSLTVRGSARFGDEGPVVWSLVSARVTGDALVMQLLDANGVAAGDLQVSPWPFGRTGQHAHGGRALGLPRQRIQPGTVTVTGARTLQPFGPVQRLEVQHQAAALPAMVIQTRARSGQLVVAGWRAVHAGNTWLFKSELTEVDPLDALVPQRLRSQGRNWCTTAFARAERQESPPLLDWVLTAAPAKGRCPS